MSQFAGTGFGIGTPAIYPMAQNPWGFAPYIGAGFGGQTSAQQVTQLLQIVPQQLQQVQVLQQQQFALLQQLLSIVPPQLQQLQQLIQVVPHQVQQRSSPINRLVPDSRARWDSGWRHRRSAGTNRPRDVGRLTRSNRPAAALRMAAGRKTER